MRKYFFYSASFFVFPLLIIFPKTVIAETYTPEITPGSPLVIILDNSGSMGECPELDSQNKCKPKNDGSYRINDVKKAISDRITQSDLASTKTSIVELGNYKEYDQTKEKSCKAVRTVLPIGVHTKSDVESALNKIKPNSYGATPLTFTIESVASNLEKNNLLPARILVITDGKPNCDEEYLYKHICKLFDSFASGHIAIKTDLIGYQAQGQDNEFIECAKKHPGLLNYGSSNNPQELVQRVDKILPTPVTLATNDGLHPTIVGAIITTIGTIIIALFNKDFLRGLTRTRHRLLVKIIDRNTNKTIFNAKVSLYVLSSRDEPIVVNTDAEGVCQFNIKDTKNPVKIGVEAKNYNCYEIQFTPSNEPGIKEIKLDSDIAHNI